MRELVEFLRARLDEDEATAIAALSRGAIALWSHDPTDRLDAGMVFDAQGWVMVGLFGDPGPVLPHIARHDPARVLAEVAAKRALVAIHGQTSGLGYYPDDAKESYGSMSSVCMTCGEAGEYGVTWPCLTLRHLAAVYSDHPDYREEWRP